MSWEWLSDMHEGLHYCLHAVLLPVILWLWNERKILQEVLEGHLERRNNVDIKMLAEIPGLIPDALTFIADAKALATDLQADPKAQKLLQDGLVLETKIKTIFGIGTPNPQEPPTGAI